MFEKFNRFIGDLIVSDQHRLRVQTLLTCLLYGFLGIAMTIVNFIQGNTTTMIITALMGLIGGVSSLTVLKTKHYKIPRTIMSISFLLGITTLLIIGSVDGYASLWAFLLPFLSFFLYGIVHGLWFAGIYLIITIVLLWTPLNSLVQFDYPVAFISRYPLLYMGCFIAAMSTEFMRHSTYKKLVLTNEKLASEIRIDALTQIENRRAFEHRVIEMWEMFIGEENYISLLLLDVDYFKHYNDYYGHLAGDEALVRIAEALYKCLNKHKGYVSRWGGEEFVCLLPFADQVKAKQVAEDVLATMVKLAIPHETSSLDLKVLTISIGTATVNVSRGINPNDVIQGADESLYEAKHQGRNCVGKARLYGFH